MWFEFLVFVGICIVIYLLNRISGRLTEINENDVRLRALKEDIKSLKAGIGRIEDKLTQKTATQTEKNPVPPAPEPVLPPEIARWMPQEEATIPAEAPEPEAAPITIPINEPEPVHAFEIPEPLLGKAYEPERAKYTRPKPEKSKSIDLEKYIGENVVNKIGIGILVIGIGFFVKYSIDRGWINETFRTLIGLLCGSLLIGLAHRLRKTYKAFSSVLIGGGLAVYYLTIAIAFHQYQLFSQPVAFGIMIAITIFAVVLSLRYDRQEIAILAIVGGFGTPLFLDTGHGNYVVLFSYLLILNVGMLVLGSLRKWPLLNILCYMFTAITYIAWYENFDFYQHNVVYVGALAFASAFYLVFFLMNIIYNIRQTKRFLAFDYTILLSNSFLYYWLGMSILGKIGDGRYQGLFTGLLAGFNLLFVLFLHKNKSADKNFVSLLIALSVSFVALLGPVQLHGNYITMYWAAQAAILLWLSNRTWIRQLMIASIIINILMLLSLLLNWNDNYSINGNYTYHPFKIILNEAFITGCFALLCTGVSIKLQERENKPNWPGLILPHYGTVLSFIFVALLYMVPLLELLHINALYITEPSEQNMIISLYNFIFIGGLMVYATRNKNQYVEQATTLEAFIALLMYMEVYQHFAHDFKDVLLHGHAFHILPFYGIHLPVMLLLGFVLYRFRHKALEYTMVHTQLKALVYWFVSFVIVFMASNEIYNLAALFFIGDDMSSHRLDEHVTKIGLPIIWGACAFLFMRAGMVQKNRTLRIISLTLLLVTVVKLFTNDISNASEIGKIIAFICLGIVLLVISFMYQRIKKLIFEVDEKDEANEDITDGVEESITPG